MHQDCLLADTVAMKVTLPYRIVRAVGTELSEPKLPSLRILHSFIGTRLRTLANREIGHPWWLPLKR
jgi:hypothetical protein